MLVSNIETKRSEVADMKSQMSGEDFMSRANMKLREWDILTTVCHLLQSCGEEVPVSAEEGEAPDFVGRWESECRQTPIEVTEALDPDYRRGDFWKRDSKSDAPLSYNVGAPIDEPWGPLRDRITDKAKKGYGPKTWLIIYYNISGLKMPDQRKGFEFRLLAEQAREPFSGLSAFERVLVLSPDMEIVVELAPIPQVFIDTISR